MIIKKIYLRNFRGFDEAEFDLNGKSAVLFGENGTGKTTVLDGIDMLVEDILHAALYQGKKKVKVMSEEDIKENERLAELKILLNLLVLDQDFEYSSMRERKGICQEYLDTNAVIFGTMFARSYVGDEKKLENGLSGFEFNEKNMPVYAYYRAGRCVGKNAGDGLNKDNKLGAFDFGQETVVNMEDYEKWFACRPECKELFEVQNQVSSTEAEREILALVGDLARRMVIANPSRENPLEGNGIVLIDEIDKELNDAWQEKIISALIKAFPNIQFIFSTNSFKVIENLCDNVAIIKLVEA